MTSGTRPPAPLRGSPLEIIEKPLSDQQRKELETLVSIPTTIVRVSVFIVFIAVLGGMLRSCQIKTVDAPPIWPAVTTMFAVAIYVRSKKWTGGPEYRAKIRQDLEAGKSRTTIIEPAFVTEIEEQEDEGPSYIVITKEGGSILLTGQWLVPIKRRRFPWSRFEISEAPLSGHFFGVYNHGEPFPVSQKRGPLPYEVARALGCFHRNCIVLDDDARKLLQGA